MITGNKGEWSEIYVFLKLLADGKLNIADENLNIIPNVYYPIIKILRTEPKNHRDYFINGDIKIINPTNNEELFSIPVKNFVQKSEELLQNLKNSKGRSFCFPEIEEFLRTIDVNTITALRKDKADIRVIVHDIYTQKNEKLGFSIKSLLGKNSTLFNPGTGTNFIYKLEHPENKNFDYKKFNNETFLQSKDNKQLSKISNRLNQLASLGFKINFKEIQSKNLELNLKLIDSLLPEILSFMVLEKYKNNFSNVKDLLKILTEKNPLNFNLSKGHPFYENKLKNFLTESALGMTPETVWNGIYDATGGIIIVKETGELVCYHIYNRNEFQNYLLNNTRLEQASTSEDENFPGNASSDKKAKPYKFGWVFEENNELFIKLNLQIRFI